VSIAIILAALVLLGAIVVVATGRGGELAREAAEEPSATDFHSGADVARYRPPAALFGYHAATTEYALDVIGQAIADRDAEIGWLRARLRELQPEGERQDGTLLGLPDAGGAPGTHPGQRRCDEPAGHAVPDSAALPGPPDPASHSSPPVQASPAAHAGDDA
jgi:hypothetical protein